MRHAVIVASSRTPLAKSHRGSFNMTRPDDLAAHAIRHALGKVPALDPAEVNDGTLPAALANSGAFTLYPANCWGDLWHNEDYYSPNDWDADGSIQKRDEHSDLGGTMRLGSQSSDVKAGTLAHEIYGDVVTERHRHRYEANEKYLSKLEDAGLVISAITQREKLTEIVELPRSVHPWFMGVQFHPEFKSTPWDGHPLFTSYIKAALAHQDARHQDAGNQAATA